MRVLKDMGPPDLRLAHLSLWVHGRERDEAADYWDGNWLRVTARCSSPEAEVWAAGTFLRTDEIQGLSNACARLSVSLGGEAALECMEPNLSVQLRGDGRGGIAVRVTLTPDHLRQQHEFLDDIDQTYLPAIIADCTRLLERYPVRGSTND